MFVCRWKEKSALCRSDGERAWLYHEIGYCYLSKREYSRAKQFAEMAYAAAEHTADLVWQLNASALIAQAETRMGDLQNALDTFKYALDMAKLIGKTQRLRLWVRFYTITVTAPLNTGQKEAIANCML